MAVNRGTYLDDAVDQAIQDIGRPRKWSISKTIAELVREHPAIIENLRSRGIDPDSLQPATTVGAAATR